MPKDVEILGLDYADLGWNGYKLKDEFKSLGTSSEAKPANNVEMGDCEVIPIGTTKE